MRLTAFTVPILCGTVLGCHTNCPEVDYLPKGPPADESGRCVEGVAFYCGYTCDAAEGVTCEDGRDLERWFYDECPDCEISFWGDSIEFTCDVL